ncbi:MAG: hypothetical protein OXC03_08530 [Flavobacteriaceae bacterium]|nr:hypothetical protein [Flavobacteriaceae bacterium]
MSEKYVFRLHSNARDGSGWFVSSKFDESEMKSMSITNSEAATSIPSPFAQFELVRTAFRKINSLEEYNGNTAHHRLVSDALDVAQLFYYSKTPHFNEQLIVTSWNCKDRLNFNTNEDNKNVNQGNRYLFETIKMYFEQDQDKTENNRNVLYNFEQLDNLYFLISRKSKQVIGATSPVTFFFASPDVREVCKNDKIDFHNFKLFDNSDYTPLYERDESFVEYLYVISKQDGFESKFPEVFDYLENNNPKVNQDLRKKISKSVEDKKEYNPCYVLDLDEEKNYCQFLKIDLGIVDISSESARKEIEEKSDFIIKPDFKPQKDKNLPLILPWGKFDPKGKWNYTHTEFWEGKNIIEEHIETYGSYNPENEKNWLPYSIYDYPWYSRDDFLEDKIIKIPYSIDNNFFWSKNFDSKEGYLLPLKPLFFKYFKVDNIDKYFKIQEKNGVVRVHITIPVKKSDEMITFNKSYKKSERKIINLNLHFSITPFVKRFSIEKPKYFVGVLTDLKDVKKYQEIKCKFYLSKLLENDTNQKSSGDTKNQKSSGDTEDPINLDDLVCHDNTKHSYRNNGDLGEENERLGLRSEYYQTPPFDLIQISMGEIKGIIVPKYTKVNTTTKPLNFVVDFGTTNTHIEYKYYANDETTEPFENNNEKPLWRSLLKRNNETEEGKRLNEVFFDQEIFPYGSFKFPFRSVLVHNSDKKYGYKPILNANNYMLYEKRKIPGYLDEDTNLKWENFDDPQQKSKTNCFIEHLLLLIYHKTILLGVGPDKVNIYWLYPENFSKGKIEKMKSSWKSGYKKVFGKEPQESKLKSIQESLGPYYNYKDNEDGNILTIDIGGGSTDMAFFNGSKELYFISSFKFGGNEIFGNGYTKDVSKNGFVSIFKDKFTDYLEGQEREVFERILEMGNSVEFSNFLFSLKNKNVNHKVDYSESLKENGKMIPVFLLFFGAVLYYSAVLIKSCDKVRGDNCPKKIIFSGGASKLITIINDDGKFKSYLNSIFRQVLNREDIDEIEFKLEEEPKKVTCKGILKSIDPSNRQIPSPSSYYWVGRQKQNKKAFDVYSLNDKSPVQKMKYSDIDENFKNTISESIKIFFELHDKALMKSQIWKNGTDDLIQLCEKVRNRHLLDYLNRGIVPFRRNQQSLIEETLFFYPLIGVLNSLAYKLSQHNSS